MEAILDENTEEEVIYDARYFIIFTSYIAYKDDFEDGKPRARKFINLLMILAKMCGFKSDKVFTDFIGPTFIDGQGLQSFVDEILEYVKDYQVFDLIPQMAD